MSIEINKAHVFSQTFSRELQIPKIPLLLDINVEEKIASDATPSASDKPD